MASTRRAFLAAGAAAAGLGLLVGYRSETSLASMLGGTETLVASGVDRSDLQEIELLEELSIGGEEISENNANFSSIQNIATDDVGNIYVYDRRDFGVKVFDSSGKFVRLIGGIEGEGPDDFRRSGHVAVGNDKLYYSRDAGLAVFDLEGRLLKANNIEFPSDANVRQLGFQRIRNFSSIESLPDGTIVGKYTDRTAAEGQQIVHIARISENGELLNTYASFTTETSKFGSVVAAGRPISMNLQIPLAEPGFAVSPQGNVYVTGGEDYQVTSFTPEGDTRWTLTRDWPRLEVDQDFIDSRTEFARRGTEGMRNRGITETSGFSPDEIDWPEMFPALDQHIGTGRGSPLRVDGHGHVYVFPYVPEGMLEGQRIIHVYDKNMNELFSGLMSSFRDTSRPGIYHRNNGWHTSRGNNILMKEVDAVSDQDKIVKYRLVEPGGR